MENENIKDAIGLLVARYVPRRSTGHRLYYSHRKRVALAMIEAMEDAVAAIDSPGSGKVVLRLSAQERAELLEYVQDSIELVETERRSNFVPNPRLRDEQDRANIREWPKQVRGRKAMLRKLRKAFQ